MTIATEPSTQVTNKTVAAIAANAPEVEAEATQQLPRLLDLKDVIKMTGLSRATIYREMAKDRFPKAVKVSTKFVRWIESEVLNWRMELPRV